MMIYPELMLALAHDRQRGFVAEADRGRLLRSARQWPSTETRSRAVLSRRDGSVNVCVPRAAAPAGP